MTVFLPLVAETPLPSSPSFLAGSTDPRTQMSKVIKSIMKAKRIVIICGAGISVQAGIPDFRSPEGLFKTLKRDNPREALASGKDLFDASVFNSEHTTTLFCQMIAQLWDLSQAAEPTAFHNVLRALDDRGKLLRVYTQNIDAIEEKCGLSFGIPVYEDKRFKSRSRILNSTAEPICLKEPSPDANKLRCSSVEPPRCIPLHGTLQMLHCQICNHSYPLEDHLPSLAAGLPPQCPDCTSMEETRQLVGKRARGIGKLRPSVVLYNEAHKDGEGVGGIVQRDLLGSSKGKGRSGADLLLVVGTSLRVPGTKRMVREFAKAVRSRGTAAPTLGMQSPTPSPRRSPANEEEPVMKSLYLNLDFPVPTREWEGVFDAWIQGDAQGFAEILQEEIEKEIKAKELATKRKRERDVETPLPKEKESARKKPPKRQETRQMKCRAMPSPSYSSKRRKIVLPPTPPKTPTILTKSHKLLLRIPPRPKRTFLIPEVCITTSPSSISSRKSYFDKGQQSTTPEKSPLVRINLAAKTRRKAARPATPKHREPEVLFSDSPLSTFDDEDDNDEDHLLPDSFVRTVQYGLRGG